MKTYKIIFSPTGGTAKVADAISKNWADPETIDLADAKKQYPMTLEENSLAVIAMPSFGGLAPQLALDRLAELKANNCRCIIAVVYGNRAYEDTMIQMKDYAEKAGFQVIAAISAIAEHSIIHAYAAGRPNANDCKELASWGQRIMEEAETKSTTIKVPGNKPYKKAGAGMVPKAGSACTSCGTCAKQCPAAAISPANLKATDKKLCIGCMRCVSICPANARKVNPLMTKIAGLAIKKACSETKKNELFF